MNKKIFTIFLIAILLIISAGVVSAADNQDDSKVISVKINWDDAAKISERPDQVKVNLIKDGNVVDTVVLKESNSWKATFKAQGDGTFNVKVADLDDYSVKVGGDANAGFIVTSSLKADVLSASEDESVVQEDSDSDDVLSDDETTFDENETDENETDDDGDDTNGTDDENATDEEVNDTASDDGENIDGVMPTVDSQKTPITKEKQDTHKIVKKPLKKHKIAKSKMRNTGLPIVALVVILGIVAFVPFSRKK